MVITCVDSRVCPCNILGFEPGQAFMVRNVAKLVPSFEKGPTETNVAIEFAVNTLQVENIFVIGHSNCAGIQALMSMKNNSSRWAFNRFPWIHRRSFEAALECPSGTNAFGYIEVYDNRLLLIGTNRLQSTDIGFDS
ncbi:beta carbonic anhydrase 5, chloroplastic-like isoform X1 [Euphorbia lathyris]|uniref:beta carbonic anhydrase 5, chloroplastic-like isoform X1 n=2 Tax=Euphorbia lathyris TaxID=212925 RepID=UPI003313C9DE